MNNDMTVLVHPLCTYSTELIREMKAKHMNFHTKTITKDDHPDFATGTPILLVGDTEAYAGDSAFRFVSNYQIHQDRPTSVSINRPGVGPPPPRAGLPVPSSSSGGFCGVSRSTGGLMTDPGVTGVENARADSRSVEQIMQGLR